MVRGICGLTHIQFEIVYIMSCPILVWFLMYLRKKMSIRLFSFVGFDFSMSIMCTCVKRTIYFCNRVKCKKQCKESDPTKNTSDIF